MAPISLSGRKFGPLLAACRLPLAASPGLEFDSPRGGRDPVRRLTVALGGCRLRHPRDWIRMPGIVLVFRDARRPPGHGNRVLVRESATARGEIAEEAHAAGTAATRHGERQ